MKASLHVDTFYNALFDLQCHDQQINYNFLVKAESIRRMPCDRPKLAESIRVCPRITATTTLVIANSRYS